MQLTVASLREYLKNIPDDFEVWIEYPDISDVDKMVRVLENTSEETDVISSATLGKSTANKKVYIYHNY